MDDFRGALTSFLVFQGLFEYVQPKWDVRAYPVVGDMNYKTFGATVAARPAIDNGLGKEIQSEEGPLPASVSVFLVFVFHIREPFTAIHEYD